MWPLENICPLKNLGHTPNVTCHGINVISVTEFIRIQFQVDRKHDFSFLLESLPSTLKIHNYEHILLLILYLFVLHLLTGYPPPLEFHWAAGSWLGGGVTKPYKPFGIFYRRRSFCIDNHWWNVSLWRSPPLPPSLTQYTQVFAVVVID